MLHIAAGVCLGIVAAIYLLNWLGRIAEWREERRERRAYRKMMRAYAVTPEERQTDAVARAAAAFLFSLAGLVLLAGLLGH